MRCEDVNWCWNVGRVKVLLVGTIPEVVHLHVKRHCMVCWAQCLLSINRDQIEIVERVKSILQLWLWQSLRQIILKPAGNVGVQAFWNGVEEVLLKLVSPYRSGELNWDLRYPCCQPSQNWSQYRVW